MVPFYLICVLKIHGNFLCSSPIISVCMDIEMLTTTLWVQISSQFLIHWVLHSSNPCLFNLKTRLSCGTVPNALHKSRQKTSVALSLSTNTPSLWRRPPSLSGMNLSLHHIEYLSRFILRFIIFSQQKRKIDTRKWFFKNWYYWYILSQILLKDPARSINSPKHVWIIYSFSILV